LQTFGEEATEDIPWEQNWGHKIGVSPGIHEFVLPPWPTTGFLYKLKIALDPILIVPTLSEYITSIDKLLLLTGHAWLRELRLARWLEKGKWIS